jgi:hypothetical protein
MESHQPANYTSDGPNFTREDNRLLHFDPEVHMQGAHCDLVAPSACCEEGPGVLPSHRSAEESMASSPLSSSTARWMLPTIPLTRVPKGRPQGTPDMAGGSSNKVFQHGIHWNQSWLVG